MHQTPSSSILLVIADFVLFGALANLVKIVEFIADGLYENARRGVKGALGCIMTLLIELLPVLAFLYAFKLPVGKNLFFIQAPVSKVIPELTLLEFNQGPAFLFHADDVQVVRGVSFADSEHYGFRRKDIRAAGHE
jgi:hypothetical protein